RYKFDPNWNVKVSTRKTTSGWDIYPYFSYGNSMLESNVPSYEMGGTMPNLSVGKCTYELTSYGRHVTSGTFTVTGEFGQKVALNDIPEQYQSFQVNVSSASANGGKEIPVEVVMDITTPDGQTNRISSPASDSKPAFIPFLPVGSRIKAAVSYDADAYPFIKGVSPANGEYTLVYDNDRQQSLDFAFEAIAKRSITGKTVTGTGADKKAVAYANVIVSQPITRNDGSSYTHKTVATSDENGDFTIPDAYAGYAGKIEIRAVGYSVAESTLASGTSAASLGEISLDYYGDYAIIPFLSKEPSALRGADGNFAKDDDGKTIGNELDGSLIDADASLLSINTIEINGTIYQRGTDWFEMERDGQSFVTFRNLSVLSSAASSGKNVIVHYNRPADNIFDVDGEKMTLRSFDITAKFGADKKLAARAVAYDPMGEITVTACDAENEGYVGYAVLSDGEQTLQNGSKDINVIGWAGGTGELIIPYKSSTKSHKLYTFYVNADDANLMSQLLKSGRPDLLDSANSGAIKTTNISKLVENSTVTLGSKQPSSCYSNIGFGPYGFDYVINAYSSDMNYAELRGIITKRDISDRDKDALYSVELSGTDSGSALIVNGEEPADDGIWYNKNTGADKLRNIISVPVYALIPYNSGTNTVDFGLTLNYKNNGVISSDSLSITEEVLNFDISVPENVNVRDELEKAGWTNGQRFDDYPWQLGINITAYKGDDRENTITIWDNGAAIGTLNAAELNGATERKFKLTDMFDAGTHSIWATREKRSGSGYVTVSTPKKSVYLNLSERDIYSGAMIWYHNGKRQGTTVPVAPSMPSIVVFPIYGASADELENVYLQTNKNG
ncbi:MAG: carboxypeptidase regulatory-like domain-containing protein, partial [Firmicutes bacterium]|nr:carboxypeptidase regulatory-like domain-containing protein [Bacillota bacterium]